MPPRIRPGRRYRAEVNDPPAKPRMAFETHAEPAQEAGCYANALAIWHTGHEFTFDFLVSSEPRSRPGPRRARR